MPPVARAAVAASQVMAAMGAATAGAVFDEPAGEVATAQERAIADEHFGACFERVRDRIATHTMPLHGFGTSAEGTKFASDIGEDDMLEGLHNRLDPSNMTGETNAIGNHEHVVDWPGAGAAGEGKVRVWMAPKGRLGGMWPIAGP
jgi:hypothetical protein